MRTTTTSINQLLNYGIQSAQDDSRAARKFFKKVLEREPNNITALLWLAGLSDSGEDSLRYVVRVLEINPKNERAHAAIRWARKRVRPSNVDPAVAAPIVSAPPNAPVIGEAQDKSAGKRTTTALLGLIAMVLILSCAVAAVWFFSQPNQAIASTLGIATATPTTTPTATATATATPTLPPTATPTATSTSTPAPTDTPTPTPTPTETPLPLPTVTPFVDTAQAAQALGEKWIDVDLTHQRLVAYEGNTPVYWVMVSTGLPGTPTVTGQYHIYVKYLKQLMYGPGYYLPDVPYVMYFYEGYGIHGTYWHNNFGHPMSHGCVNAPTPDAAWLYEWAPVGTLVNVHY